MLVIQTDMQNDSRVGSVSSRWLLIHIPLNFMTLL